MIEKRIVLKKGAYITLTATLSEINEILSRVNRNGGICRTDILPIAEICEQANEIIKTMHYIENEFKEFNLK